MTVKDFCGRMRRGVELKRGKKVEAKEIEDMLGMIRNELEDKLGIDIYRLLHLLPRNKWLSMHCDYPVRRIREHITAIASFPIDSTTMWGRPGPVKKI